MIGADAPLRVPRFIVIGGGETTGVFYVRQLRRAVAAGRLETEEIVVVDRNASCPAADVVGDQVRLDVASWNDWLFANLDRFEVGDQLVPYHWAPHLLVDWLARHARAAGALVSRDGDFDEVGTPFERTTGDGDRALSYATWTCPPTCIEPELCPHTSGEKDWSLAGDLEQAPGGCDESIVFPSYHLIYGVATIPVSTILAARVRLLRGIEEGSKTYRIATASHCHGLATRLLVTPQLTALAPVHSAE